MDNTVSWGWYLALGIFYIIFGLYCLYAPFAASLAVEIIIGAAFFIGGCISLVQVFMNKQGSGVRTMYLILGIFNIVAGVLLLMRPLEGLMALTMLVIVAILINGGLRVYYGLQARPVEGWGWIVAGGAVSVLIAIYWFTQYPEISAVLLGIFAAISLIGEGAGYARYAYGLKTGKDMSMA